MEISQNFVGFSEYMNFNDTPFFITKKIMALILQLHIVWKIPYCGPTTKIFQKPIFTKNSFKLSKFKLILLLGMTFHAGVVFSLDKIFLSKSILGHWGAVIRTRNQYVLQNNLFLRFTDKRRDVWSRPSCIYTQIHKMGFPP